MVPKWCKTVPKRYENGTKTLLKHYKNGIKTVQKPFQKINTIPKWYKIGNILVLKQNYQNDSVENRFRYWQYGTKIGFNKWFLNQNYNCMYLASQKGDLNVFKQSQPKRYENGTKTLISKTAKTLLKRTVSKRFVNKPVLERQKLGIRDTIPKFLDESE